MERLLNEKGTKVVWILGSGFSQSLGGPMLKDLLGPRTLSEMRAQIDFLDPALPEDERNRCKEICELIPWAQQIFEQGSGMNLWANAEDFLDTLEAANLGVEAGREPSSGRVQIQGLLDARMLGGLGIRGLAKTARHAVALNCSGFLRGTDVNTEKWEPYRDWARSLNANHSVVTFNYDRIPNLLEGCEDAKLCLVGPDKENLQATLDKARIEDKACILKVHGSVDWGRDGNRAFKAKRRNGSPLPDAFLFWRNIEDFAIGIPGPAKRDLVATALQHLWDEAMARIRNADIIVFVGYRFPPSDSMARRGILKAIQENPCNSAIPLKVLTVLGPNNPDEPRLLHLLKAAKESALVIPKPLYAQDFLSLLPMHSIERTAGLS